MFFFSYQGDIVGPGFFEPYLNAENLMRMPYGGAEQNMFNFAANLYFLEFMKVANRLDNKIMNTALEKMTIGKCPTNGDHVNQLHKLFFFS